MRTDCIFVVNNPGSFNVLFPIIKETRNRKIPFKCFIGGYGQELLSKENIPFQVMHETYDEHKISNLLTELNPGALIAGSSLPNTDLGNIESYFTKIAKSLRIYTITILDFWGNYRIRFSSDYGETLDCLPDLICAADTFMKDGIVDAGFPENLIAVTGNPCHEHLWDIKEKLLDKLDARSLKIKLGFAEEDCVVSFLSQPILDDHGTEKWGYDETVVLNDLVRALGNSALSSEVKLMVKFHPRENHITLERFKNEEQIVVSGFKGDNAFELLAVSDLIVGMTSMLLIEAHLLNFNCFSYQPDKTKWLQLPYDLKVINSFHELKAFLQSKAWKEKHDPALNALKRNQSIQSILNLMEEHLPCIR